MAAAYAVPALVAAIAVQTWFRGDTSLATGDLVPPVAPGTDYQAHWNAFDTGAGAPSYQVVSLPYFEGLRLFARLGLGEVAFQRLWLTVLVAGTAAAVVFLARGVVRSPLAAAVAGFVPLFSAYRLTLAFDPVPLVAMIAAALLGGLMIRAGGRSQPPPLVFALATLPCGFVFLNPPHLALVTVWIVVCTVLAWAVHGDGAPRRVRRFLLTAAPLALLFNLWWIVPAAMTLTGSLFGERYAAAGVDEWAWTHARASVPNVVALTSTWAWPYPEYFPFSGRLDRLPFSVLAFVPFLAAALGFVVAVGRRRQVAVILAVVGVLAIWVMKGLHGPLGETNGWLYDNVPGFWLLRDPTKAGLVLVLVFALLAALGVARLADLSPRAAMVAAALVVAGGAAYAHPLLTGAVVPAERPLLPSAHVAVPPGWRAAADYLATRPGGGKVVVLPRLDYYQAPTTWGYYGASFLHQLIHRPVIEPVPEAYYRDSEVDALVTRLQAEIRSGNGEVTGLLQALGAKYIVLRRDIDTTFPGRSLVRPALLARRLAAIPGLRRLRGFGVADVYEAPAVRAPEVYPASPVIEDRASLADVRMAVAVPRKAALVTPSSGEELEGIPSGQARVVPVARPKRPLAVRAEPNVVVVRPAGERAARPLLLLPAPDPPYAVLTGTRHFTVRGSLADSRRIGLLTQRDLVQDRRFFTPTLMAFRHGQTERVGDCNRSDDLPLRDVGIRADITGKGERATLHLAAREHSGCVSIPISTAREGNPVDLRFSYRNVTGNPARVCVWQDGPDRCARVPALDPSAGWHRLEARITPAPRTRSVRVFFYADGQRGSWSTSRTEYRRLTVAPAAPSLGVVVHPRTRLPRVSYRRTSPSEFRVRVVGAERPFVLVAAETFAPGWKIEAPGRDSADAAHFEVNGYANGWRIPWTGSYELTISYGPEGLARAARRLDLVAIPLGLLALALGPVLRRRRRAANP